MNSPQKKRTFDLILDAVLPEYRDRVAEYLIAYKDILLDDHAHVETQRATAHQLKGYLRGLNTTRVLGMADFEELDRRITQLWPGASIAIRE